MNRMFPRSLVLIPTLILGSFFLYCSQAAVGPDSKLDGSAQDGFVRDARGQSGECCKASAPTFTQIADITVPARQPFVSQDVAVAGQKELVFYQLNDNSRCGVPRVEFKMSESAPFAFTGQNMYVGRVKVDGTAMRLTSNLNDCDVERRYIVAAVN